MKNKKICLVFGWIIGAIIVAFALASIALKRGESINALWLIIVSLSVYFIGYRYYSRFIANKIFQLDDANKTPAVLRNDGLDYVPTNKNVLFGHHFAAIAGAGPLVGPVLAAQMGYLPALIWLLIGAILAGAVQDFMVLVISTRKNGKSLGEMIKEEVGISAGIIAIFGTFIIMIILLAVLALIVVKALAESPWGTFTVACTIPIAIFMGLYSRYIRPAKILEISIIGFILLILAIFAGEYVAHHQTLSVLFTLIPIQLTWGLIIYGFIASVLPVWLILAPRDYLSTFLKIGVIIALAIGILLVAPELKMPALTKFIDGSGPVWAGNLFPFLFITIACGAVSGFHSLIASGTTPKLLEKESDARFIGYGAMLMESFVALMVLVTVSCIDPALYFAMNSPSAIIGTTAHSAASTISSWGFLITPEMITNTAHLVGEKTIISRTGGAPTLAVGMAQIFAQVLGGTAMMGFWYHFAILFEALFILTAVDAGTRAGRFMLQDLLGIFIPKFKKTDSLIANLIATALCVGAWGYFLYQGVLDPLGGVNSLWPLFGISNQMLAGIAFIFITVVLFRLNKVRFAWISILPLIWLLTCTLFAATQKIFNTNAKIGFLAHADKYTLALNNEKFIAPAKNLEQMHKIIMNDYINASLTSLFILVVLSILILASMKCYKLYTQK